MVNLDATIEFFGDTIAEIKLLISYAKRNRRDFLRYGTFNKSAIVLLCGKFESYLENALAEYAYLHLHNSTNKNIDTQIYERVVEELISGIEQTKNKPTRRQPYLSSLIEFCGDSELSPIDHFTVTVKFSYGKHGQKEVERLLRSFGFEHFVQAKDTIEFFRKFNSLNNIRNNIIHEDATPTLSDRDVENYLGIISNFIKCFDKEAVARLRPILERGK